MKLRHLILAFAGMLVLAVGRGQTPCPPSQLRVDGGGAATTTCPSSGADDYSTNFIAAENPLSEGGMWINGKSVGLDWNNVQSIPGRAYAAEFATGYNDPIAVLNTSFGPNQFAEATVYRASGYSPSVKHEVELLLRFEITARNARGYEVLWGHEGKMAIVRWNGPRGNYTTLLEGPDIGEAVDGDLLRAEITGGVVRVFKNGSLVATGPSDTTWTDGQPGIGFWPRVGSTRESYGWKSYRAGSL